MDDITTRSPNDPPWEEVDGLIQARVSVFVAGKGWLTSRRSLIYGGRHGEPPMIIGPESSDDIVLMEVKTMLRALRHAYRRETGINAIAGEQTLDDATRPRRGIL